jgi:hypothetical protein
MTPTSRVVRWARLLWLGGNPLARRSDRAERAVLVVAILLALVAVPFAALLGSHTYERESLRARTESATRHQVTAILLADAPSAAMSGRGTEVGGVAPVPATWTRSDGAPASGTVLAHKGSFAGDRVRIWLDGKDELVPPPLREDLALWHGIGMGLLAWLAAVAVVALLCWVVHLGFNRARYAAWGREWQRDREGAG